MNKNEISEEIQKSEWVGTVSSPSTNTSFRIDVLEKAYDKELVGSFCIIEFTQNGDPVYVIGQITQVTLSNPHIERAAVRKIISIRGDATHLSREHDIRLVEMNISSAYVWKNGNILPTTIGSVPPTGTKVFLLNQAIMDRIVRQQKDEIFYIGKMYNTNILLPFIFRHFGPQKEGGLGEAYHVGIFGKTGSGKSVLAKMILVAYARHPSMSIIVFDSTGEYSREIKRGGELKKYLSILGREVDVYDVTKIALQEIDTLRRLLRVSNLLHNMGIIAPENQEYAIELIIEFFERNRVIRMPDGRSVDSIRNASNEHVFLQLVEFLRQNIGRIYATQEAQSRVLHRLQRSRDTLFQHWRSITALFSENKISVESILSNAYSLKRIIFIDLSGEVQGEKVFWNDKVKAIALREIVSSLKNTGSKYYQEDKFLNLLVVIDEAHRFIPREKPQDEDYQALKNELIDCVRTTRKYGLGWLFISQSLASLDLEILRQIRLYFIGYGLSWGTELFTLKDMVGGGPHIELYQSFRDPQTSVIFGEKQYPFMVFGPGISPLSVSGSPLFFNALDYFQEFFMVNPCLREQRDSVNQ